LLGDRPLRMLQETVSLGDRRYKDILAIKIDFKQTFEIKAEKALTMKNVNFVWAPLVSYGFYLRLQDTIVLRF